MARHTTGVIAVALCLGLGCGPPNSRRPASVDEPDDSFDADTGGATGNAGASGGTGSNGKAGGGGSSGGAGGGGGMVGAAGAGGKAGAAGSAGQGGGGAPGGSSGSGGAGTGGAMVRFDAGADQAIARDAAPQDAAAPPDRQAVDFASDPVLLVDAAASADLPAAVPGTAVLTVTSTTTPASVNLTAEGTVEWVHWCYLAATAVDRKQGTSSIVLTPVGPGPFGRTPTGSIMYSWSDGTPTVAATDVQDRRYASRSGSGHKLTVPAGTTPRTLKVYLGVSDINLKVDISLGDGSAPAYSDSSLVAMGANKRELVYTIRFAAASAGQTLTAQFVAATDYIGYGSASLAAATLQ